MIDAFLRRLTAPDPDPLTGDLMTKSSWIVLHDNLVFGCGIYLGEIGI